MSGTSGRRGAAATVLAATLVVIVVGVVAVLVHGAVLGRTLAGGDDWRIVGRWGLVSPTITVDHPSGSTGTGPLLPQGTLSESTIHRTSDGSATYVVGVLPDDARTVRVTTEDGTVADTRVQRVVTARFYVAALDGHPDALRLEAVDERGDVIERMHIASPSRPGRGDRPPA